MKDYLDLIAVLLPLLIRTEEAKKRSQRIKRYRKIKRLRRKRDKGKITLEVYEERLEEINRLYPNT